MKRYYYILFLILVFSGLYCSEDSPTESKNRAPAISEITTNPDSIGINGSCLITCVSADPDGDSLIYSWTSQSGAITILGSSIEWKSPGRSGLYSVSCKVEDAWGLSDSISVDIKVYDDRIVFYSLDQKVYVTDINLDSITYIANGAYPIWLQSKSLIGFHSPSNDQYRIINVDSRQIITTYDITGYGTFTEGRYSEYMNNFLFAVNFSGNSSIALMNIMGQLEFISSDFPMTNPVCSGVDDWIYFLIDIDGTRDVWRMKPDGSSAEPLTNSQEYYYSNLSISYDGNFICVPKWNDSEHYIAIIDTRTNDERLIDLTNLNLIGFTSFTLDNEHIYFTGGDTRDLYRIDFDGTDLIPLTDSMFSFYYRPLYW